MPDPNWAVDDFRIEPLSPSHDRSSFSCGVPELDRYFRTIAGQDRRKRVAAVFVLTPDSTTVAGFYTLSQFAILLSSLPDRERLNLPTYPEIPATLLGRLAIDTRFRGHGLGNILLYHAFRNCLSSASRVASAVLIVDAKDDDALRFYARHGFQTLSGVQNRLFISLATLERLLPFQDSK